MTASDILRDLERIPDLDDEFDTGMSYREALRRAGPWWNRFRGIIRDTLQIEATANPDDDTFHASAIIRGDRWAQLDSIEQAKVATYWHHYQVRFPLGMATEKNTLAIAMPVV